MGQRTKTGRLFAYDPKVGDLKVSHFYPEASNDKWTQAALTIEGQIANLDVTYAGSYLKRDVDTNQDYTDYSYFYDQVGYGFYWTDDTGNLVNPSQYITGHDGYARRATRSGSRRPQDKRFRFVGGVFYQRQQHNITQNYKIDGISRDISVPGYPRHHLADRPGAGRPRLCRVRRGEFDITDKLTAMTGGIRFFKADNSLEGFFGYGTGYGSNGERACFRTGEVAGAPCTNLDKRVKETGNSPKVTLTYKFDSDKLVYVTYSKGFRPGGINRRGTLPPYQADYLKNYEFGWKTTWLDNRFRWNGAVFMEDWQNFQFSILGANGLTEIKNANQARIKGLESDITLAVAHGFTINGSAAYTDAKLTANYCGVTDASGNPITTCAEPAGAGRHGPAGHAEVQGQPDGPLRLRPGTLGRLSSRPRPSARPATGPTCASSSAPSSASRRASDWSTCRAGVTRDDWSMSVYIKNIFDKRASLNRYAECAESVCGAQTYITPNQPRMGDRLGKKFGRKF
jgi:iron complex outermembrane receptor protein